MSFIQVKNPDDELIRRGDPGDLTPSFSDSPVGSGLADVLSTIMTMNRPFHTVADDNPNTRPDLIEGVMNASPEGVPLKEALSATHLAPLMLGILGNIGKEPIRPSLPPQPWELLMGKGAPDRSEEWSRLVNKPEPNGILFPPNFTGATISGRSGGLDEGLRDWLTHPSGLQSYIKGNKYAFNGEEPSDFISILRHIMGLGDQRFPEVSPPNPNHPTMRN